MQAGFYKIIDRQSYTFQHETNLNFLKRYGDVFEVNSNGTHFNHPNGAVVIMAHELCYFEYLGTTMPVPKPTPTYRLGKRTPKTGEVWTMFDAYGTQHFCVIQAILGPEGARKVRFNTLGRKGHHVLGMSKFCRQPAACFEGVKQYRVFSH